MVVDFLVLLQMLLQVVKASIRYANKKLHEKILFLIFLINLNREVGALAVVALEGVAMEVVDMEEDLEVVDMEVVDMEVVITKVNSELYFVLKK